MPIDRFMELALSHPEHGYYMKRDPFGAKGDFTTAPEISQIFGEMIAVWAITAWEKIGSPAQVAVMEIGAGRGTLMADFLRAIKVMPSFKPQIHIVDISPTLTQIQQEKIGVNNAVWHKQIPKLDVPTIVIANEFFDALPIKQFVNGVERKILTDGTNLYFSLPAEDGLIKEVCHAATSIMNRLSNEAAAGIIIDYGYILESSKIDTLQALKGHKFHSVLEYIGDADITAHVDFHALAKLCKKPKITTQRNFLLAHGADVRAKMLGKEADLERLISTTQMGNLFKVLCF